MQIELIAGIGAIMTIIGFVTVFIKIGIDKGDTSRRLQNVEQKIADHDRDIDLVNKEIHGIQKETAGFMAKIDTTLSFIKDSLARLEKKKETSDA